MLGFKLFHIVFYVFGIRCDDGAVEVVVCIRCLVALKRNAGIEDGLYAFLYQPAYMTMRKLCRIALRFAGDGFYSELVYLSGGRG